MVSFTVIALRGAPLLASWTAAKDTPPGKLILSCELEKTCMGSGHSVESHWGQQPDKCSLARLGNSVVASLEDTEAHLQAHKRLTNKRLLTIATMRIASHNDEHQTCTICIHGIFKPGEKNSLTWQEMNQCVVRLLPGNPFQSVWQELTGKFGLC